LSAVARLFVLFTALPLLDLWLLLHVGRAIGFWNTVALVILTGMAGAWLARAEGFRVLRAWQDALAQGRVPEEGVLSGALVLAGALLLVTPGVLSDVLGLALLFPPSRRLVAAGLRRWLRRQVDKGRVRVFTMGGPPPPDEPIDVTPQRPDGRRSPSGRWRQEDP
jgi:UPF0716 protein FxsA